MPSVEITNGKMMKKYAWGDVQLHSTPAARRSVVEKVAVVEDVDTRAHLANRFQSRARSTAPDRVSMTPQVSVVNGQIVIDEEKPYSERCQ